MHRGDLEHLIRAAAAITDEDAIVVVGSQSILGAHPNAPEELLGSNEADIFARNAVDKSDLIDGSLGEGSFFDKTFGYYAQGVDETTSMLPRGWKGRLVRVNTPRTGGASGYCLDPLDLACAKLYAARDKDHRFVEAMLDHALVSHGEIRDRIRLLPSVPGPDHAARVSAMMTWLDGWSTRHSTQPRQRRP